MHSWISKVAAKALLYQLSNSCWEISRIWSHAFLVCMLHSEQFMLLFPFTLFVLKGMMLFLITLSLFSARLVQWASLCS